MAYLAISDDSDFEFFRHGKYPDKIRVYYDKPLKINI
jgi:hypothetical protein